MNLMIYIIILNVLIKSKKCFKIKENKNIEKINKININNSNNNGIHSDSTKDSNSDNN